MFDIKIANRIYRSYYLQTSAYSKAYEEETGNKIEQNVILNLPKVVGKRLLPIKEKTSTNIDLNFTVFRAFLHAWKWENKKL